jgi:hypothetical protein
MKYLLPPIIIIGLLSVWLMGCYPHHYRSQKVYRIELQEDDVIKVPTQNGRELTIELEQ